MTAAVSGDKAYYRNAASDVFRNQDTDIASALIAEIRQEITEGKPIKDVTKALRAKGAPEIWALAAVKKANDLNWREIVSRANADMAEGRTESADVLAVAKLADSLMSDPRLSQLGPKLRAYGCSEDLIERLCKSDELKQSQKTAGFVGLALGTVLSAFGLWAVWPGLQGHAASTYDSRGGIAIVLGLVVVGRSALALMKK